MKGTLLSSIAASAVVKASQGRLLNAVLAAGSDTATLIIYDDPDSADGTVLLELSAVANTTASVEFTDRTARLASTGLYAALTGTAPRATIGYE